MMILFVCFFVFLAGFVDSIAGGGGLISLPAYMMSGFPIHKMLGTNKATSTVGTFVSVVQYYKSGNIHLLAAGSGALLALFGSYFGASFSLYVAEKDLKLIMVCILPFVCIFISRVMKKREEPTADKVQNLHPRYVLFSAVLGLVIGFYDGMLGPGTGTFLTIGYSAMGFSMATASGNTKLVNLSSNIAAFFRFFISGNIVWGLALPAMLCGMLGNYLGSKMAIKKGAVIIRPLLFIMVGALFVTFIFELVSAYS